MVGQRRGLLNYLMRKDIERYRTIKKVTSENDSGRVTRSLFYMTVQ